LNRARAEIFNVPQPEPPQEEEEEEEEENQEAIILVKVNGMWKVDKYYIYPNAGR
jgi:hypothetical protein